MTTSIEALKRLSSYPLDAMLQEVGPLALLQKEIEKPAVRPHLFRTVETELDSPKLARHALSLMLGLEDGLVIPLGREAPEGVLVLGRADDADVQFFDASVSGHHAQVKWDGWKRAAWLKDLGSTNGTLVNGNVITAEVELAEGNVITVGDSTAFLFLRTETLYALVRK